MLVCSVVLRPRHASLAADIGEAATARDVTDFVTLFGTVVDSPGNATDTLNAVVGQFMVETASAADVVTVGMAYRITVLEDTTAVANNLAVIAPKHGTVTATVTEAVSATATQDAAVVRVSRQAMSDSGYVNSDGTMRQANVAGTMINL